VPLPFWQKMKKEGFLPVFNRFLTKIQAFLRRDFIIHFSYRFAFMMNVAGILTGVAAYYFLAILFNEADLEQFRAYGSGYFSFILIGIACFNYMNVALGTFSGSIRQAQISGTLEAMILTKTPPIHHSHFL